MSNEANEVSTTNASDRLTPEPPAFDERLATLVSYLDPDGGLRVPQLSVVDEQDRPLVVVRAGHHVAEVMVGLPAPQGQSALVRIFAHDGEPGDPDAGSTLGIELVAEGNGVYDLSARSERPGEWVVSEWFEDVDGAQADVGAHADAGRSPRPSAARLSGS